ncbi:hypothetical protein MMC29_001605 [Sticta canariensis]|nr:hypothetical protein [Sticta canariensis]
MSCLDPKVISQSILPPLSLSNKQMTEAIGTLSAYSFVTRRFADEGLDLHRLVHLATRNWLRKDGTIAEWTAKTLTQLNKVFPAIDLEDRTVWRAYLPHVRHALRSELLEDDTKDRVQLLESFGLCLLEDGRYEEAEDSFTKTMNSRKRVLGQKHPSTLMSMAK